MADDLSMVGETLREGSLQQQRVLAVLAAPPTTTPTCWETCPRRSPLGVIRHRLPWLLVCLAGTLLSGGLIDLFGDTLAAPAVPRPPSHGLGPCARVAGL